MKQDCYYVWGRDKMLVEVQRQFPLLHSDTTCSVWQYFLGTEALNCCGIREMLYYKCA